MPTIDVFSRRGCHLCEVLIEELLELAGNRAVLEVRDVDTDAGWLARYGNEVPVVVVDGQELCRHRLDRDAVKAILADTQ